MQNLSCRLIVYLNVTGKRATKGISILTHKVFNILKMKDEDVRDLNVS